MTTTLRIHGLAGASEAAELREWANGGWKHFLIPQVAREHVQTTTPRRSANGAIAVVVQLDRQGVAGSLPSQGPVVNMAGSQLATLPLEG